MVEFKISRAEEVNAVKRTETMILYGKVSKVHKNLKTKRNIDYTLSLTATKKKKKL